MNGRLVSQLAIGVFLLCLYAASYGALLHQRSENRAARMEQSIAGVWNLPPVALGAIAGEFKGLVADYLTLEVGAQLGTQLVRVPTGGFRVVKKEYDWPSIHRIFVASQSLDPSFAQTFLLAQGWLPWDADMIPETQKILETAANNRPWDWQPLHTMGFNAYYFLEQPGKAGGFFLKAAKTPAAPTYLAILGARLAQKGGETESAIVLMKSMLVDKNETDQGYQDMLDRLHALEGSMILEEGIKLYEKRFASLPQRPEDLISSRILNELPSNPYNVRYCIDKQGVVYFDSPQCRDEKIQ